MRREQYYNRVNIPIYRMITSFCMFLLFISTGLFLYFFFYQSMMNSLQDYNDGRKAPAPVYEQAQVTIPKISLQETIAPIPLVDKSARDAERIFTAYELGDNVLASRFIVDFITDYPQSPFIHKVRLVGAYIMNERGDYQTALSYIQKILGNSDITSEDYSEAVLLLGSISRERKQHDSYIQSFLEKAFFTASEPTKSKLAFYLGYLFLHKGEFQSSLSYFNQVIGEDGLLGKAALYQAQVMRPESINELENFLNSYPASSNYDYVKTTFIKENNLLAQELTIRGYLDSAERFYKKITQHFPDSAEGDQARIDMAELYYQKQNHEEALVQLHDVLKNNDTFKDPDALFVLGKISFEMDKQEEALGYFRSLIEKYPRSSYIAKAQEWQELIFESLKY